MEENEEDIQQHDKTATEEFSQKLQERIPMDNYDVAVPITAFVEYIDNKEFYVVFHTQGICPRDFSLIPLDTFRGEQHSIYNVTGYMDMYLNKPVNRLVRIVELTKAP